MIMTETKSSYMTMDDRTNLMLEYNEFHQRLKKHYDELKWLYCELYENGQQAFENLCSQLETYYINRKTVLKEKDREREKQPDWY